MRRIATILPMKASFLTAQKQDSDLQFRLAAFHGSIFDIRRPDHTRQPLL